MRSKLSVALLLGLIVAGAAWAFDKPLAKTKPVSTEGFGCCVTGDCCCPGQGSCCDPKAKAKATTSIKIAKTGAGCCATGNCCCPGQGNCCAAVKVNADAKAMKVSCCGTATKAAAKVSCCPTGACCPDGACCGTAAAAK